MIPPNQRCAQRVLGDYDSHQCSRRGVVEEEGKVWCRQHLPSAVKARREESDRRWREGYKRDRLLDSTRDELIQAALETDQLDDLPRLLKARTAYREARQ